MSVLTQVVYYLPGIAQFGVVSRLRHVRSKALALHIKIEYGKQELSL